MPDQNVGSRKQPRLQAEGQPEIAGGQGAEKRSGQGDPEHDLRRSAFLQQQRRKNQRKKHGRQKPDRPDDRILRVAEVRQRAACVKRGPDIGTDDPREVRDRQPTVNHHGVHNSHAHHAEAGHEIRMHQPGKLLFQEVRVDRRRLHRVARQQEKHRQMEHIYEFQFLNGRMPQDDGQHANALGDIDPADPFFHANASLPVNRITAPVRKRAPYKM